MGQINRLLAFYLVALSILFISVAANLVLTDRLARQIERDASEINLSGRQRMLSQRIIYLAHDLSIDPQPETRAALLETLAEFEAALDLFETSHSALSRRPDMDAVLSDIYFSEADGPSLDARVRDYIDLGRAIAADPADARSLAALKAIEKTGLLADLDTAVSRIEAMSVEKVDGIRQAEYVALGIAGLIVLLEIAFVFLPGHRLIKGTMAALAERNDALERTGASLTETADALERERERLQDALAASEALRREQAEFTYAVSHDLKSPANSLKMLLDEIEYLAGEDADEDLREMLGQSQRTVGRMTDLVEDVLAYAWSTDRREEIVEVDLNGVVRAALDALDGEIVATGARITLGDLGAVRGYRRQLEMLVQNLVSNALKYRAPERVPEISISTETVETGLVLSVTDNGIGIPEEHLDRVFGMFMRLHRQDQIPGSGLGLSVCQRVASNHGGRMSVRSSAGAGSTFSVTLASGTDQKDLAA